MAETGGWAAALRGPPAALRLGAAVAAAALLTVGGVVLKDLSDANGECPGDALAASGEVARIYAETSPPVTVVYLRGDDAVEYRLDGDVTRAYGRGHFVALCGKRSGDVVEADTIRHAPDPWLASAPLMAAGGTLGGALAADFLVRSPLAARLRIPAIAGRLRLGRLRRRAREDDEAGFGDADNHSGAPAPKG